MAVASAAVSLLGPILQFYLWPCLDVPMWEDHQNCAKLWKNLHSVIVSNSPRHKACYKYVDVDPSFPTMKIGMHMNVKRRNSSMMTVSPAAVLEAVVVVSAHNVSPVSNKVNRVICTFQCVLYYMYIIERLHFKNTRWWKPWSVTRRCAIISSSPIKRG